MDGRFDIAVSLGNGSKWFHQSSLNNVADLFDESIFNVHSWNTDLQIKNLILALNNRFNQCFTDISVICNKTNLEFYHIKGQIIQDIIDKFKIILHDFYKLTQKRVLFLRSISLSIKNDLELMHCQLSQALEIFGFNNFHLVFLVTTSDNKYQTCDKWIVFKNRSSFIQDLNNGMNQFK